MNEVVNGMLPVSLEARGIDKKWEKKIVIISEWDTQQDGFKDPTKYYFCNAFGDSVYLRTRSYTKAVEMVDEITGKKGFYNVRTSGVI